VVKADAYGHGAVPLASALVAAGCGVLAAAARRRSTRVSVHVEIDTGMHRMGVPLSDAESFLAGVAGDPALTLAGVMTHFACADEPDLAPTRAQLRAFADVIAGLRRRGIAPGCVHAANSAGLVALAELAAEGPTQDAVRPGLLLYGARPSAERPCALRPVMSLRAPVVALRRVRRGEPVGYAALYRARADTRIATLALGYADGVPISASGRGSVWLAGARRPIAGRVSMDYLGVEVGDAAVQIGDSAVVFGSETEGGPAVLPVEEAAASAGTISYELLVRVGARVRRELV
jgi:alanine racemase